MMTQDTLTFTPRPGLCEGGAAEGKQSLCLRTRVGGLLLSRCGQEAASRRHPGLSRGGRERGLGERPEFGTGRWYLSQGRAQTLGDRAV